MSGIYGCMWEGGRNEDTYIVWFWGFGLEG